MLGGSGPSSPRGAGGNAGLDDPNAPPMPEPLASPEVLPRPSALGTIVGSGSSRNTEISSPTGASAAAQAAKDAAAGESGGNDNPTSPTMTGNSKTRSKSILDLKKKQSTLSDGNGAEEMGDDGELKPIFPASVREGYLKKKGVVNLAWKKRYIVLLPHQLAYYEDKPTTADALPKGFINLASILRCEHHDAVSSLKDCTFDVVTPTRIFRLQAESPADMDAWIASISGTAANEQQILASRRRNVSHAALRTLDQDKLKIDDSATISHEIAELRQWPNWNTFEVAAWIQTFGMGRYSPDFYNKGITGDKLKSLDDSSLVQLGIDEKPDRVKILTNVKKLIQDTKRS
jgi:hypothetical protein